MNKYGNRLKELRKKYGYTQEELAKLLNTSRSRIGMYEQGKRQPDFEMQETLADFFNVTLDYLFDRKESDSLDPADEEIFNRIKQLDSEKKAALLNMLKLL